MKLFKPKFWQRKNYFFPILLLPLTCLVVLFTFLKKTFTFLFRELQFSILIFIHVKRLYRRVFNVLILYGQMIRAGDCARFLETKKTYNLYGGEWISIKILKSTSQISLKFINSKPIYLSENILKFLFKSPTRNFVTTKTLLASSLML